MLETFTETQNHQTSRMTNEKETDASRRQRRDKYISKACQACRRRKIKCSGHDTCLNCVDRRTECVYDSERRRRRGHRALKDRAENRRGDNSLDDHTIPEDPSTHTGHSPVAISPSDLRASNIQHTDNNAATRKPATPQPGFEDWLRKPGEARTEFYPINLPPPMELKRLLQQFFVNVHPEYPFLSQHEIESSLAATLDRLDCHPLQDSTMTMTVRVDSKASSFMILFCVVMAISQMSSDTPGSLGGSPSHPPGYMMYEQSSTMLQTFNFQEATLDIIQSHMLHALYLLDVGKTHLSLQSHAIAVRLLTARRDPDDQPSRGGAEHRSWWAAFILDRTISRVCGISYSLRAGQMPSSLRTYLEQHASSGPVCDRHLNANQTPTTAHRGRSNKDALYLEAIGYVSHLWGSFFDQSRSQKEISGCCLRLSALLDAELQVFRASIDRSLRWDPGVPPSDAIPSEEHTDICRRLVILSSTNILRLGLRQKAPGRCTCFSSMRTDGPEVVQETLEAVQAVREHFSGNTAPSAFTITHALAQCVLYLLAVLEDSPDSQDIESEDISEMIEEAYGVLMDMASTCIPAKIALSTLDEALFSEEDQTSIPAAHETHEAPPNIFSGPSVAQGMSSRRPNNPPSGPQESCGSLSMVPRANSLLGELEAGYQDLDLISPEAIVVNGWLE